MPRPVGAPVFCDQHPPGPNTQDGSLEFDSKYGCTQPDQSFRSHPDACGVEYSIERAAGDSTLSAVHIGEEVLKPLKALSCRVHAR